MKKKGNRYEVIGIESMETGGRKKNRSKGEIMENSCNSQEILG